MNIGYK